MSIKDGGPAFPSGLGYKRDKEGNIYPNEQDGMTLRDYFAAKAMEGTIAKKGMYEDQEHQTMAAHAFYEMADAMLKAREEG